MIKHTSTKLNGNPTLDLEAIRILQAIEKTGSFAAAARALGKVPSALTYSIRKLEDELDVLLFDRAGKAAVMTPAGRELLEQGGLLLKAASDLTARVQSLAQGWEPELRIAVDGLISMEALPALIKEFYTFRDAANASTQLRLSHEILDGGWDALIDKRSDLSIGLPYDAPLQALLERRFSICEMGAMSFAYCVSPKHPLATVKEPIDPAVLGQYRAVAVAGTAINLPARSVGLMRGQDTLTVATLKDKIQMQIAGLAVGYIPLTFAKPFLKSGQLITKKINEKPLTAQLHYAWPYRSAGQGTGNALSWWLSKLAVVRIQKMLIGAINSEKF